MSLTHFQGLGILPTAFTGATGSLAIPVNVGTAVLTKTTAGTNYTLAVPKAGTQQAGGNDGDIAIIFTTTAADHIVTAGAGKINGATHGTLTFGGDIGDGVIMQAYGGVWYVISNVGVTVG